MKLKNKITKILISGIIFFGIIFLVTGKFTPLKSTSAHHDEFNIIPLDTKDMPFTFNDLAPLKPDYPTDEKGVILYGQQYYHPVEVAQMGLQFLDSFNKTSNQEYLNRSELHAQKLLEKKVESKDAFYFPYEFDFAIHGNKNTMIKAPWYSGMAQGEALSLFTRLYKVTGKKEYQEAAKKTFQSFLYPRGENQPWTVFVDDNGFYWIEEYAGKGEDPVQVLNGYIFGLYGVYDYYLLNKDPASKEVLEKSLATLRHYLPEFRSPGNISFYDLKYKRRSESYHKTHIAQLKMLYKMTGDDYFKTMADNFYNDHH
ncbi:MAG: D-glucuronyl C5-epimerase family protein [Patescibacteria group bacterium]|nr:D-glucuronyl C5-epimerase family protein [Patescibacteria group bacterium]